jgi:hypothetical protein
MQTIETTAQVTAQGLLIIQLPVQLPPGTHAVVVVVDDRPLRPAPNGGIDILPTHDLGEWPARLSLRREDFYDDWGR